MLLQACFYAKNCVTFLSKRGQALRNGEYVWIISEKQIAIWYGRILVYACFHHKLSPSWNALRVHAHLLNVLCKSNGILTWGETVFTGQGNNIDVLMVFFFAIIIIKKP